MDIRPNGEGRRALNWGKWIYFGLLLVFAVSLANYLVGSSIFLRAEGIVLQPITVVAAPYDAHVREIAARQGQRVEKGMRLASLQSAAMTTRLSELSSEQAKIRARIVQLESRLAIVRQVLPLAESSEKEAADYLRRLQELARAGHSTLARLQETAIAHYNAIERRISLNAEFEAIKDELKESREMLAKAEHAHEQLRSIYNDGEIISPVTGTIGPSVASAGEVLLTGKPLLEIFSGERYVLAFLPREHLFAVGKGDKVVVNSGMIDVMGTIDEVLPVTDSLPSEYRNAFRPRERSQLVRISLQTQKDMSFAIQQPVRVSSCLIKSCEPLSDAAIAIGRNVRASVLRIYAKWNEPSGPAREAETALEAMYGEDRPRLSRPGTAGESGASTAGARSELAEPDPPVAAAAARAFHGHFAPIPSLRVGAAGGG